MEEHVQSCSTPQAVPSTQQSDCATEQSASSGYLKVLDELVTDAVDGRRVQILADALAWTFARIATGCGPAATGDMLAKFGSYMITLETRRQAERELKQVRKEGHLPH